MNIKLSRAQIIRIGRITNHFLDVEQFELDQDNSSGIGPTLIVAFELPENVHATVDITDIEDW